MILWIIIPSSAIIFTIFTPRFIFQKTRVSHELNHIIESGVRLEISLDDAKIIDYCGRWFSMYTKLELSFDKYEQVKKKLLLVAGTVSNKDFTEDVDEKSKYTYSAKSFQQYLSVINNVKSRHENSMNLENYDELLMLTQTRAIEIPFIWGTTGGVHYVLIKEDNGSCYLYIIVN